MKSPAMKFALGPVYQIEADMRDAWEGGLKDKAVEDALAAITQKDSKKRAEKALRSGDHNQARSLLEGRLRRKKRPGRARGCSSMTPLLRSSASCSTKTRMGCC